MYDLLIIGGGLAGSSAALFAAKAGKKTLVIDSDKSMTKRAWLNNHLGVDGISGPGLLEMGKQQAKRFGAEYLEDEVVFVVKKDDGFTVKTKSNAYDATHVVFATGVLTDLAEKVGLELVDAIEPRVKRVINVDAQGKTNIPNIWAVGTAAGVSAHTIITSGHGAQVAINIISELNGERYVDHDVFTG